MNGHFSKKNAVTIFMILILSIFCIGGCAEDIAFLRKGKEFASQKDWDQSVKNYQKALAANPDSSEIQLLLRRAKFAASMAHMVKGQEYLNQQLYSEAIGEFKMSISYHPANRKAIGLMEKALNAKKSNQYYRRGEDFLKAEKFFDAKEALKRALELNPENEKAKAALSYFKKEDERLAKYRVDLKTDAPVSFKFKKTPIFNVFEVLSRLSGINFIFDKEIIETKVTMFMTDISFDQFIEVLLSTNKLASKLVDEKTMLIYPDTPAKAKEYQDLQIRTFYLDNLQAEKAVRILSKVLKSKDIIANKDNNSVVIRGSKDVVEIASRIIKANDGLPAEVLLHVEILEVRRTTEEQLGLTVDPTSVTLGLGEESSLLGDNPSFDTSASIEALDHISRKNVILSLPTATLNFLKQDGDTKILAKPQLRVKNNEKAIIHVGERIPLRTNRRTEEGGAVTFDFQYFDVGVKLDVVPTISRYGEISLKMTLEISQLGENLGTPDDPQFAILTRKAQSVLSVPDGELVFIGGLIQDTESETVRKFPFLGEVPILGRLFSNFDTINRDSDVIMTIIPVIIREHEPIGADITNIWSGNERNPSLGEPFESYIEREGAYLDQPVEAYFEQQETDTEESEGTLEKPEGSNSPSSNAENMMSSSEHRPASDHVAKLPEEPRAPIEKDIQENSSQDVAATHLPDEDNYFWPESVRYSVHVNSFPEKEVAQARIKELSQAEYECYLVYAQVPSMGNYYRIFVGKFNGFTSAQSFCQKLKGKKGFAEDIHVADREWAFGG
ncbi:MAG: SPOR domain-containing protein [Desulfobacterales bacterium]|nr:MAG: SPOR domain-containing protein [Desulfobacterales bacterium]